MKKIIGIVLLLLTQNLFSQDFEKDKWLKYNLMIYNYDINNYVPKLYKDVHFSVNPITSKFRNELTVDSITITYNSDSLLLRENYWGINLTIIYQYKNKKIQSALFYRDGNIFESYDYTYKDEKISNIRHIENNDTTNYKIVYNRDTVIEEVNYNDIVKFKRLYNIKDGSSIISNTPVVKYDTLYSDNQILNIDMFYSLFTGMKIIESKIGDQKISIGYNINLNSKTILTESIHGKNKITYLYSISKKGELTLLSKSEFYFLNKYIKNCTVTDKNNSVISDIKYIYR